MLVRELRKHVPEVVGIDLDRVSVDQAEAQHDDDARAAYVLGDFLTHPFEPASFDFVAAVATLHHVDACSGLSRIRGLLSPGGVMCVVGLARSQIRDLPLNLASVVAHRYLLLSRKYWQHPSPTVWPPPETYRSMRRMAAELLPGARFQRHILWRYSLIWTKPSR
jgi:SAM-dependent methyltransferase